MDEQTEPGGYLEPAKLIFDLLYPSPAPRRFILWKWRINCSINFSKGRRLIGDFWHSDNKPYLAPGLLNIRAVCGGWGSGRRRPPLRAVRLVLGDHGDPACRVHRERPCLPPLRVLPANVLSQFPITIQGYGSTYVGLKVRHTVGQKKTLYLLGASVDAGHSGLSGWAGRTLGTSRTDGPVHLNHSAGRSSRAGGAGRSNVSGCARGPNHAHLSLQSIISFIQEMRGNVLRFHEIIQQAVTPLNVMVPSGASL